MVFSMYGLGERWLFGLDPREYLDAAVPTTGEAAYCTPYVAPG